MMPSRTSVSTTGRCILVIAVHAAIACGGRGQRSSTSVSGVSVPPSCSVLPRPATPADSISAVFTTPVSTGTAPMPSTPAEQFVFAHAYETLLGIDCQGVVSAGLAKSWTPVAGSDGWRIVLRADARFWSGARVTSADVISTWRAVGQRPVAVLARHLADRATIVDDTTLDIRMGGIAIRALGSAELAVARRAAGSPWPEGSGPYRIAEGRVIAGATTGRSSLTLVPLVSGLPRITVYATTASDARDLVDLGTDLLVTDDRALSTYVGSRSIASWRPLDMAAWTWVVVSRGSPDSLLRTPEDGYAIRAAMAADVVRAHARPAAGHFWSLGTFRCDSIALPRPTQAPSSLTSARVVYRRDEPVAQAIAERLVALASAGDHRVGYVAPGIARAGARSSAAGLAPNEFDTALRHGRELAFVLPIRRQPNLGCVEAQPLAQLAPWLVEDSTPGVARAVASLIETRPVGYMITDRAGVTLTGDGTLVLLPRAAETGRQR